jgi:G3E family GTPase
LDRPSPSLSPPTTGLGTCDMAWQDLGEFARLDGIVTLVDAKHIEQHLDERKPDGAVNEAVNQVLTLALAVARTPRLTASFNQVAFANGLLLLNKVDLLPLFLTC